VSEASTTKLTADRIARTEVVEARHWIERQLRWERTLGSLRDHRSGTRSAARAA